jgi:hypothetical protein
MTLPEVDQELERLFSVARAATVPEVGTRERIRAGLAPRLVRDVSAPRRARGSRVWFGAGVAVLGACAIALWLTAAPQAPIVSAPLEARSPSLSPTPTPSLIAAPPVTRATVDAAAPVVEGVQSAPSLAPSKPPASSAPAASPAEELPLVRAMQQALRAGNPSQAIALAADHARRFPRGSLVEEREGVRAVARCQLAAPDARAPILAAFTQRFVTSPYAARVKAACQ